MSPYLWPEVKKSSGKVKINISDRGFLLGLLQGDELALFPPHQYSCGATELTTLIAVVVFLQDLILSAPPPPPVLVGPGLLLLLLFLTPSYRKPAKLQNCKICTIATLRNCKIAKIAKYANLQNCKIAKYAQLQK